MNLTSIGGEANGSPPKAATTTRRPGNHCVEPCRSPTPKEQYRSNSGPRPPSPASDQLKCQVPPGPRRFGTDAGETQHHYQPPGELA
ncbi:MAG: hypothetical protein QOK20_3465 [Acidimicrobiaceae bacterium]|nr:hypothetical protein [Acidimicrobiaceae bacterium]